MHTKKIKQLNHTADFNLIDISASRAAVVEANTQSLSTKLLFFHLLVIDWFVAQYLMNFGELLMVLGDDGLGNGKWMW